MHTRGLAVAVRSKAAEASRADCSGALKSARRGQRRCQDLAHAALSACAGPGAVKRCLTALRRRVLVPCWSTSDCERCKKQAWCTHGSAVACGSAARRTMLALLQRGEAVACRLVARGCAAAQARQASAGAGDLKPLTPIPANDYERKVRQPHCEPFLLLIRDLALHRFVAARHNIIPTRSAHVCTLSSPTSAPSRQLQRATLLSARATVPACPAGGDIQAVPARSAVWLRPKGHGRRHQGALEDLAAHAGDVEQPADRLGVLLGHCRVRVPEDGFHNARASRQLSREARHRVHDRAETP